VVGREICVCASRDIILHQIYSILGGLYKDEKSAPAMALFKFFQVLPSSCSVGNQFVFIVYCSHGRVCIQWLYQSGVAIVDCGELITPITSLIRSPHYMTMSSRSQTKLRYIHDLINKITVCILSVIERSNIIEIKGCRKMPYNYTIAVASLFLQYLSFVVITAGDHGCCGGYHILLC